MAEYVLRNEQIGVLTVFSEREYGIMFAEEEPTCTRLAALLMGDKFVEGGCLYGQRLSVGDALQILINERLVHVLFRFIFIHVISLFFRHDLFGQRLGCGLGNSRYGLRLRLTLVWHSDIGC